MGLGPLSPLGNEVLSCRQEQGEGLCLQSAEFLLAWGCVPVPKLLASPGEVLCLLLEDAAQDAPSSAG